MRILQTALLTVAGGVLIALVLSVMTMPPRGMCCPVNFIIRDNGGIDPWTGEVRPTMVDIYDHGTGQVTNTFEIPHNWRDLRVIPLPVGFAVGSLVTLGLLALVSRRPRGPAPKSTVPAA